MRYPGYIEEDYSFPPFYEVSIKHPDRSLKNPQKALRESVEKVLPSSGIKRGDSVAIGVGSRGISNIRDFVSEISCAIIDMGAKPFIIPAMGSHGGATSEGQAALLGRLGITAESCGAPIISSMDVVKVGEVLDGIPLYFSKDAMEMDHSVCINRIKPHTKFKGAVESGLCKMVCVGMGKHQGAVTWHRMALKYGFSNLLQLMGKALIESTNFRFGLAVVEDFFEKTMHVEAVEAENLFIREPELLKIAKESFPHLPFRKLDVLVVGKIGKEISGSGMDPNVTGRTYDLMEDDFSSEMKAGRVVILDLSDKSGGNAIGLGNADIITDRVFKKMDYESTIMNALTSLSLRKAFIPVILPDDRKAIQAAFTTLGPVKAEDIRSVIIKDTLHTADFIASESLISEIECMDNAVVGRKMNLEFTERGELIYFKTGSK